MYPVLSSLFFCVISVLGFFFTFAPFSDAKEKEPGAIEYPASRAKDGETMRVLWTVSDYLIGKNASWGSTEAKRILFKPLDMTSSSITFDGRTCRDVTFKKEKVDAAQYLAEKYQITPAMLGCREKMIEVIKTNCNLPGFSEYMRLRDRKLIVPINGILFVFEPAINH